MKLVFTGIQGCGKGTQAKYLVENHGFKLLEMGLVLRKMISSKTPLGNKIKEKFEAGFLITSDIIGEIIKEVLEKETSENLILDGFVRNIGNKESLENIIDDYKVVFFELPKEKAIERLLGRMYNPETGETFQAGTILDPKTGDKLVKRIDDNETAILKRIDEFMIQTLPVVEIQKSEGKVININADGSIEEVSREIKEKLEL